MALIKEDNGDAGADASTQYTIVPGDVFQGRIDPDGDNDWIRVELDAATVYDVRLTGIPSVQVDIQNAQGYHGADGYYQTSADKFIFSMPHSEVFYIRISSSDFDFTGDYELSIAYHTSSTATHEEIADYMTYSPPGSSRSIHDVEPGGVLTANITALDETDQQLARWALESWSMVVNFEFNIVDHEEADIIFGHSELGFAFASLVSSGGFIQQTGVYVPVDWTTIYGDTIGTYTFEVYLHEIGHALGLDHPGPYGYPDDPFHQIFQNDTNQTSVMSYFHQGRSDYVDASSAYAATPMIADIIAIHDLYGTPVDINPGDTVYGYGSNVEGYLGEVLELWIGAGDSSADNPVTLTLYDSNGSDTLDLRTDTSDQRVDLHPEGISDVYGLVGNLIIAQGALIENYTAGSGNDLVIGNDVANHLRGLDGNDELRGSGGDDILEGGDGADRLDGGAGMDWASYQGSNSAVRIDLADAEHADGDVFISIENVRGSAYADVLQGDGNDNGLDGGPGDDELRGNGGDDVLEGGAGADRLTGGAGEDTASYTHSPARVIVRLHSGETRGGDAEGDTFAAMVKVEYIDTNGDTQQQTVPDIESLQGSVYADTLAGDSRANRLAGGAGDDRLFGGPGGGDDLLLGGPGADDLYGGIGDDVLEGGPGADSLKGGSGADTASYMQSAEGVEIRLHSGVLRGGDAEGDVLDAIEHLISSAHADILEGDAGVNRLDGGPGVDWLSYAGSDAGVDVRLRSGAGSGGHAEGDEIANIENMEGSHYDDVFGGDSGANHLSGRNGNDGLWGSSGDDTLEGGAGADRLFGGGGTDWVIYPHSDTGVTVNLQDGAGTGGHAEGDTITDVENISGSAYDDVLTGDGNANELVGGAGDDELLGNAGNDLLEGGAGIDRMDGGSGMDTAVYRNSDVAITVNLSDGTLVGGHAEGDVIVNIESVWGSAYNDTLIGDDGFNRLDGHDGDDLLDGGAGGDHLDGGAGTDTLVYRNSNEAVMVNLRNGTLAGGHAEGDVIINFENIEGSNYDDNLIGGSGANRLDGGEGNDRLQGGNGNDELFGNDGDDLLAGGQGVDFFDGGAGVDTVSFANSKSWVEVDLFHDIRYINEPYVDSRETVINIENVIGSAYPDILEGDYNANELYGRGGNDRLFGFAGDDNLYGGDGDDQLWGSSGADLLDGGPGIDMVSYSYSYDEGVTVKLGGGTMEGGGEANGDVFVNVENVQGTINDDVLEGDNGPNRLSGEFGNDSLKGGDGADQFVFGNFIKHYIPIGEIENGIIVVNIDEHDVDDNDVILDFTDNEDLIDLTFFSLSGFDDLTITSDANGVTIDLSAHNGGTILLEGFDIANLDASDFLF